MKRTDTKQFNRIAILIAAAAIGALALPGDASAKQLTPDQCRAQHMKGDGKHVQALFKCWSKAAKRGEAVDEECIDDVHRKNAKYVWENTGYGCTGNLDVTAAITRRIEDSVADHLYDDNSPVDDRCAADKLKAAGKYGSTVQKLGSKLAKTAGAYAETYAKNRLRAEQKLAAAFVKAESRGNCNTVGDILAVQATMDDGLGLFSYCDAETSDGNVRDCSADESPGEPWDLEQTYYELDPTNGWEPDVGVRVYDLPSTPQGGWFSGHYLAVTPAMSSTPSPVGSYDWVEDEQAYLGLNRRYVGGKVELRFIDRWATDLSDWVVLHEGVEIPLCSAGAADPCMQTPVPGSSILIVETSKNGIYQVALPF
jgi:hypothetical protein